jgi:predicted kinase
MGNTFAPALVIVTGPPASGKSTLAARLSADLAVPLIAKDDLKETLFDTLGWGDAERSRAYGAAAVALLFRVADALLAAGQSLILECNFRPGLAEPEVDALRRKHPFRPVQVYCYAPVETLSRRFRERWAAGRRHPGHVDDLTGERVLADLAKQPYGPLDIGGPLIRVDTGADPRYEYAPVREAVRRVTHPPQ